MKKVLALTLVSTLALQAFALSAHADDRVNGAISSSQQARSAQISDLQAQISKTQQDIKNLETEMQESIAAHPGYRHGLLVRKIALITVGVGAAVIVHAMTKDDVNMDEVPEAFLGAFVGVIGGVGTAVGQGMVWLNAKEVNLVSKNLSDAKTQLGILQRHLQQIQQ